MRGQAMAAGVVSASVTAYASSRSRFLGARLERARRRERVRACARFQPRTGERSSRVPRVFADAGSGSDVPTSGSSKLPSQKIPPLYVKRTVRSSTVRHPGTIVVMGDVDAESSVIAGGDVFVWGSLRGSVIAGQGGDYKAKVSALDMRPSSLQIGSVKGNVKRGADGDPVLKASGSRRRSPWNRRATEALSSARQRRRRRALAPSGRGSRQVPARHLRRGQESRVLHRDLRRWQGVRLMVASRSGLLLLFNVQAITEGWIRVFGVICVAFGVYYFGTAYGDGKGLGARAFYLSTVVGRVFIFASFLFMVACVVQRARLADPRGDQPARCSGDDVRAEQEENRVIRGLSSHASGRRRVFFFPIFVRLCTCFMPVVRVVVKLLQSSFTVILSEGHRRQSLGKSSCPSPGYLPRRRRLRTPRSPSPWPSRRKF